MIDDDAVPARGGWRVLLPVSLLLVVALAQVTLARTSGLSPWKGGGFGMFSTTDDSGRRYVRIFVNGPDRSEEIGIAPSLEDAARRVAVLPLETAFSSLGRAVVDRERRHRRSVESVRIEAWRVEYALDTLAATTHMTREYVYRAEPAPRPRP